MLKLSEVDGYEAKWKNACYLVYVAIYLDILSSIILGFPAKIT